MTEPRQPRDASPTHAILLWVGIAAGLVFIVAVVFFSGFFIGRGSGGGFSVDRDRDGGMYPGMMFPNRPGSYGPWGPGQQPASTTAPATPRP